MISLSIFVKTGGTGGTHGTAYGGVACSGSTMKKKVEPGGTGHIGVMLKIDT